MPKIIFVNDRAWQQPYLLLALDNQRYKREDVIAHSSGDFPTAFRREYDNAGYESGIAIAAAWNGGTSATAATHSRAQGRSRRVEPVFIP